MKRKICNFFRLIMLIVKLCASCTVCVQIALPSTIRQQSYRQKQHVEQVENFRQELKSWEFRFRHHFCTKPEGKAVNVTDGDALKALNLPNSTKIVDRNLLNFGSCLAKTEKLAVDSEICICDIHPVVLTCLSICAISAIVNLREICAGIWKRRNDRFACLALGSMIVWAILALQLIAYQWLSRNEILLNRRQQTYFQTERKYFGILVLACVQSILSLIDYALFFKFPREWGERQCCRNDSKDLERLMSVRDLECKRYKTLLKKRANAYTWP